jgi:hypothetical protein
MSKIKQVVECNVSPDNKHAFTTGPSCDYCGRGAIIIDNQVAYCPSEKQDEYHHTQALNVLFYGGRGSGKSMCGRWDAHMRAMSYPNFKYCILRRTYPELLKSHLIELPREMRLLGGDWNSSTKQARYPNGSVGFFSHCQNEQDVLNLLSAEFYLMFFDEISTFEWDMFRKLQASCRVPQSYRDKIGFNVKAAIRAATNPLGTSAEMVNRYWILKDIDIVEEDDRYNPKDWYSIKANVEDNPYLPAEEYRAQFSGMSSHVLKAWVDGEFSIENALFDFRPTRINEAGERKPWHVVNDLDLGRVIKNSVMYRALDAGWYPDPTVCLWIAHLGNRHIVINEKMWFKTEATKIAEDIKAEDARLMRMAYPDADPLPQMRVAITYCDPSIDINTTADIRTIKEIYESCGIPMENSINDREQFATALHQALAEQAGEWTPRLQLYVSGHKGAPYLSRTIPQMRFNPKHFKKMDDHKDDHAVVALAYYLMSHAADPRRESELNKPTPKWMQPKLGERKHVGWSNTRTEKYR